MSTSVLTWGLIKFTTRRRWLDIPVERSAHRQPMPSAGGVAMLVPFLVGLVLFFLGGRIELPTLLIFAGCLVMALIGLVDDLHPLAIRWRLPFQFASALWILGWAGVLPSLQLAGWRVENPLLINGVAVLSFVWLLNLFNFMDGIDGLAATETSYVTLLSCLLAITANDQPIFSMSALTGAVALGFLVWNWAPAKIFMGDAGSSFLGYCLGALAITSLANGTMNPWSWLLLLGVFVVDATYTLLYRILSGQRWYEGHSSHAYQHAARLLGSHRRINLLVLAVNLLWLAPLAWLANNHQSTGLILTVVGLIPLVLLARWLGAGTTPVG
ncbi:MAG: glycosyltransferase family 4 protein [Gammaproteobacteria bacterium]|nr:glycosyltransferase family 4 protein [Pseudomonadales bacterium]